MEDRIRCPHCGTDIPLSKALSHKIEEGIRQEYEAKAKTQDARIRAREASLEKERKELDAARRETDRVIAEKLKVERAALLKGVREKAREELQVELKDLKEESAEKERRLEAARKAELELRKKTRDLEEGKRNLDLELARKLDEEREKIRHQTLAMFSEEHRLKDMEKEKKIGDMLKTIAELKRKGEQGSMQTQGEVLELDLEALLRSHFPTDEIEPVPKGIRGADILQQVYNRSGQLCGTIIWESKRTKAWSDGWIAKLKDDQRAVKAEIAVIVTEVLPSGVTTFTRKEGVWITDFTLASSLAEVLRSGLTQLALAKLSAVGRGEKMEVIYNYLSGPHFRQRVEGIVEAFKSMKEELDQEKRAITRTWAKREKQIERVITNTAGMYGDVQGIIGASLPEIAMLELDEGEEEIE
ncbi:MAG: DUF2130 domain-containing protein [Thermodesulfobacteriota bacterium]